MIVEVFSEAIDVGLDGYPNSYAVRWICRGRDYELCAQGKTRQEALEKMHLLINAQRLAAAEEGKSFDEVTKRREWEEMIQFTKEVE